MTGSRYFENKMTVKDVDCAGKRVLVRVDFNVPLGKDGGVADDFRIRSALPTLEYILKQGSQLILMSHLGRPKGKRVPDLSLAPVREALESLLKVRVEFAGDCIGSEVEAAAASLAAGEVLLLENLRFHSEETDNDPEFAKQLAALADIYVNDAFGTAHRAHASTEGITHFISPAVAGFLLMKEIEFLGGVLVKPEKPFIAILGGAKVSGKIDVIKNLMDKVDGMLIGGGMANTFLKAEGAEIGSSLFEESSLGLAGEIMKMAESRQVKFLLPVDYIAADRVEEGAATTVIEPGQDVPVGYSLVDVGPATVALFGEEVRRARTVFWNGPMGIFEVEDFSGGTVGLSKAVAEATAGGTVSILGGGDTASAARKAGVADMMTHISTGGGASLEFVEGKQLPGIAALTGRGEV
ncbi:MAG: phosphoglycerate kinase [bacterium]|jgi:phosphoglycerate kinase